MTDRPFGDSLYPINLDAPDADARIAEAVRRRDEMRAKHERTCSVWSPEYCGGPCTCSTHASTEWE